MIHLALLLWMRLVRGPVVCLDILIRASTRHARTLGLELGRDTALSSTIILMILHWARFKGFT